MHGQFDRFRLLLIRGADGDDLEETLRRLVERNINLDVVHDALRRARKEAAHYPGVRRALRDVVEWGDDRARLSRGLERRLVKVCEFYERMTPSLAEESIARKLWPIYFACKDLLDLMRQSQAGGRDLLFVGDPAVYRQKGPGAPTRPYLVVADRELRAAGCPKDLRRHLIRLTVPRQATNSPRES